MKKILYTMSLFILISSVNSFLLLQQTFAKGQPSITFRETNAKVEPTKKHSLPLILNTNGADVVGIDIMLTFDPSVIKIKNVLDLNLFQNPIISKIDNNKGIAKFSFINNSNFYTNTYSTVLIVNIEGLDSGNTTILIDKDKSNIITKEKVDILEYTNKVNINVEINYDKPRTTGITNKSKPTGIEPIKNTLPKVLGTSDTKKPIDIKSYITTINIIIFIGLLIITKLGFMIYKSYKKSLDNLMKNH